MVYSLRQATLIWGVFFWGTMLGVTSAAISVVNVIPWPFGIEPLGAAELMEWVAYSTADDVC